MPIVPPGSIYSPGDEIAESLAIIGGSIPAIFDPRRGVRDRVQEYMEDPTKIEALAQRLYPQSITVDPITGVPYVDEEKRKRAIRDTAVALGLNPDNEREYGLIGPVLDAAMTALPAEFKVKTEMGMMSKTREQIAKQESTKRKAEIAQYEAEVPVQEARGLTGRSTSEYLRAAEEAGIPTRQALLDSLDLENQDTLTRYVKDTLPELIRMAENDPALAAIMKADKLNLKEVAAYIREGQIAAMRMISGKTEGLDVGDQRLAISTMVSDLRQLRLDIEQAEGFEAKKLAVDAYKAAYDQYQLLARNAAVPVPQMPIPMVGERPVWGGLLGKDDVISWRTVAPFNPSNIPPKAWDSFISASDAFIADAVAYGMSPEEISNEIFNDINEQGLLGEMEPYELDQMVDDLEARSGVMLTKLRHDIRAMNAMPQLPEGWSALGLLFNPEMRAASRATMTGGR